MNLYGMLRRRIEQIPFELTADSAYEQQQRAYERRVNEGIWRGYQQIQEGNFHPWEEVKAELQAAHEG